MDVITAVMYDEVVERCQQGDAAGYSILYKRYSKAMYNTALRIVNNVADAEDVLQEAFTDAFSKLQHFNFSSTFGAWLKKIVINKSLNLLRKKKLLLIDTDNAVMENITDTEMPDESYLLLQVAKIKKAMQMLDSGYRSILSLYLFEGYDHEEIAEIMQVPPPTVRTQYMRARQKLVTLLNKPA